MATRCTITSTEGTLPIIDASELSAKEQEDFDYLDWPAIMAGSDSASFFRYRGELYDVGEFQRITTRDTETLQSDFAGWDGYTSDSFFSGMVIKFVVDVNDDEAVIVGTYIC